MHELNDSRVAPLWPEQKEKKKKEVIIMATPFDSIDGMYVKGCCFHF